MQPRTSESPTEFATHCRAFARPVGVLNHKPVYVWDTGQEPIAGLHTMRFEDCFRRRFVLSCVPAVGKIRRHFVPSAATTRIAGTSDNSQQAFEGT